MAAVADPSAAPAPSQRREGRGPAVLYGSLFVASLIVLVAVALAIRQPPPPTIAEFAPQALAQIVDPPKQQATPFGQGEGDGQGPPGNGQGVGEGPGAAGGGGTTTAPPVVEETPRTRRCVGSPPRQIADPQSPPCVPFWSGDNGGATYKGVSATEIRIAVPDNLYYLPAWESFFNKRFEFYGRKLRFVYVGAGTLVEQDQRARAIAADEVQRVFGSLGTEFFGGEFYADELARRKLVYSAATPFFSDDFLAKKAPYLWQYAMADDRLAGVSGEWFCKRLAGQPARWAGTGGPYRDKRRKLGVALMDMPETRVPTGLLEAQLAQCGEKAVVQHIDISGGDAAKTNAILTFKSENVTSVLVFSVNQDYQSIRRIANDQQYFPEYLGTNFWNNDVLNFEEDPPAPGSATMFGISSQPAVLPLAAEPYRWAALEGDPGTAAGAGDSDPLARMNYQHTYRSLLLLASGIQMAGPNLTPTSFERGLQGAVFPNPDHPNKAGRVGFGGGSHTMTTEIVEFWWGRGFVHPDTSKAISPCYVSEAARYAPGRVPRRPADDFFTKTCHIPPGGRNELP